MKILIPILTILVLSIIISGIGDSVFAQDPSPPPSPEPTPTPDPIYEPEPEPVPDPFPELDDKEKINQLLEENKNLKDENKKLKTDNQSLKTQNNYLAEQINIAQKKLSDLQAVANEQIKLILQLISQIKEVIFSLSFSQLKFNV